MGLQYLFANNFVIEQKNKNDFSALAVLLLSTEFLFVYFGLLQTVIGAVAYWLFGYAFAFGGKSNGFIGHEYFALANLPADKYSNWFFHFVFAATAATIVSGAMAERTEFKAYLIYSMFLTGECRTSCFQVVGFVR